jgi:ADP-heptose:LPS heptosyltransferase
MGDHLIATGIPEAYYKLFGEKTYISSKYSEEFWNTNPYVTNDKIGNHFSLRFNSSLVDYMIYYPVRVFYDITGQVVDRKFVHPYIYKHRNPNKNLVVINEQAGWPSRRGYKYFNDLAERLIAIGFTVCYLNNSSFRDCLGQPSPRTVTACSIEVKNPPMHDLIQLLSTAKVYIGYDSGLAQLAGALKVPTVSLYGSIPAINTMHDYCIYYVDNCQHCCADQCTKNCLSNTENKNGEILERVLELK